MIVKHLTELSQCRSPRRPVTKTLNRLSIKQSRHQIIKPQAWYSPTNRTTSNQFNSTTSSNILSEITFPLNYCVRNVTWLAFYVAILQNGDYMRKHTKLELAIAFSTTH